MAKAKDKTNGAVPPASQLRKLSSDMKLAVLRACTQRAEEQASKELGFRLGMFHNTKKFGQLSEAIYNEMFDAKTRRRMSALPAGFLPEAKQLTAYFAHQDPEYGGKRHFSIQLSFKKARRFPYQVYNQNRDFTLDTTKPAAKEMVELYFGERQAREKARDASNRIEGFLKSMRTTKALLTAWPELMTLMPEGFFLDAPTTPDMENKYLVAQTRELNAYLHLPVQH